MGKKRKNKTRKVKQIVAVLYESGSSKDCTENDYFTELSRKMKSDKKVLQKRKLELNIKGTDYSVLDERISSLCNDFGKDDQVFICCDADILGDYSNKVKRSQLLEYLWSNYHEKRIHGTTYHVLIWNICIETWFLMHFGSVQKKNDAHAYLTYLRQKPGFDNYNKTRFNFGPMIESTQTAIITGQRSFDQQLKNGYKIYKEDFNPGTNMHKFFEESGIELNDF